MKMTGDGGVRRKLNFDLIATRVRNVIIKIKIVRANRARARQGSGGGLVTGAPGARVIQVCVRNVAPRPRTGRQKRLVSGGLDSVYINATRFHGARDRGTIARFGHFINENAPRSPTARDGIPSSNSIDPNVFFTATENVFCPAKLTGPYIICVCTRDGFRNCPPPLPK